MYKYSSHEKCSECNSHKLVSITAKVSDMCHIQWYAHPETGNVKEQCGYVPKVLGLGDDSDYLEFKFCIDCGQVQNYKQDYKQEEKVCTQCGRPSDSFS